MPTINQFKTFCQAGDREYQAVARAKAAAAEKTIGLTSSLPEEISIENSQASSAETSTEDAIQL